MGSTAPPEGWWGSAKSAVSPTTPSSVGTVRSAASPSTPSLVVEPKKESPPAIPAKSPKRQKSKATRDAADILRALEEDPFTGRGSFRSSRSKRKNKDVVKKDDTVEESEVKQPEALSRSLTNPVAAPSRAVDMPTRAIRARANSSTVDDRNHVELSHTASVRTRLAGVRGARIDKSAKRLSTGATIRAEGLDFDDLSNFLGSWNGEQKKQASSRPSRDEQPQVRRTRQGETLSMLVRDGFFPGGSMDASKGAKSVSSVPPPLALLNKALPPTPTAVALPAQLYPVKVVRPLRPAVRNTRKPAPKRRNPLSQISTANSRRNDPRNRLPAIPESQAPGSENTPPQSGRTTPIATQIHLRGGSVVTVCPPELTAWQRTVYFQGPIKLPKPVIIPRKNSVASLEPFQEVIDQVYQDALSIPRRRSDEQVVDDVCGFFDEFGFEDIGFVGDRFDSILEEGHMEDGAADADGITEGDIERFSTSPMEPEATPVEKVMAKGIMGTTTKPLPVQAPPVSTSEALRARGIARVSQVVAATGASPVTRKDSHTLISSPEGGQLQLLPVPEDSMLDAVLKPSRSDGKASILTAKPGDRNSSGSDSIEELDGSSSWIAPLFARKIGISVPSAL